MMASGGRESAEEQSLSLSTQATAGEGYSDPGRLNTTTTTLTADDADHPAAKEIVIGVDLFAVVASFAVLLTLSSVGTVSNVLVLAVIKYRKSFRAAVRRDAALGNLSIVHLILCCVLSPLEFATLAENYVKHSLPAVLCLARDCGFHLLVGANVIGVVILAACQARRLQRACAVTRSTGWGDALPVLQLALPWIAGACAAGSSVAIRLVTGLGFEVCRKSIAFWEELNRGADPWQFELLPGFVYFLLLLGALVWLLSVVERNRKYGEGGRKCVDRNRKQSETVGEEEDSSCQRLEAAAAAVAGTVEVGVDLIGREKRSPAEPAKGTAGGGRGDGGKGGGRSETKPTEAVQETAEDNEEDDDDDTFDLKMRHEFEKKSRSSGRRHTVANIGLPADLSDLRSSATDAHHQPPYASRTAEYHYVRKWSVDITALANQLENPKSHSDTSPFKEKEEGLGYEETRFKGLRTPSNACVVTSSCEYLGPKAAATGGGGCGGGSGGAAARRESVELRSFQKGAQKPPKVKEKPEQRPCSRKSLTPAAATPADEAERRREAEVEGGEASGQKSPDDPQHLQKQQQQRRRDTIDDDRVVAKVRRELTTTSRMSAVIITSLIFTFPCLVIFLWLVAAAAPLSSSLHIGYNLSIVAEIIVTLQAAVNPALLFWVDRRLQRRLRNLIRDMAHLRCVCYCNIGRHGNCLPSHKGPTASYRQAPCDGGRPMQKV